MVALKVTQFDDADALTGDEVFGFVQGTENRKSTLDEIVTYSRIGIQEWAPNWNTDLDLYIPANTAMTIDQGNAAIGIGSIAFEQSTAADPDIFESTTLPATLEAGAWLKLSGTGVDTFLATHLIRTA
jgi:hypothetical protein